MIDALDALNKIKLILLCKTLYLAWFNGCDATHKQKKSNSLFVLGFLSSLCLLWVVYCYSCFGLVLHVEFNFGWEFLQ